MRVYILYLYGLVLSDFPRCGLLSVIDFGKLSAIIISKNVFSVFFLLVFQLQTCYIFWNLPQFLEEILVFIFLIIFFYKGISIWKVSIDLFQARWFHSCTESIKESTEGTLHFSYSGFDF